MVRSIWKFPLLITDEQRVTMPQGSQPLEAEFQRDTLCLWAVVDPDRPPSERVVNIIGTGNPVPEEIIAWEHLSTVQDPRGFVWHIFVADETRVG